MKIKENLGKFKEWLKKKINRGEKVKVKKIKEVWYEDRFAVLYWIRVGDKEFYYLIRSEDAPEPETVRIERPFKFGPIIEKYTVGEKEKKKYHDILEKVEKLRKDGKKVIEIVYKGAYKNKRKEVDPFYYEPIGLGPISEIVGGFAISMGALGALVTGDIQQLLATVVGSLPVVVPAVLTERYLRKLHEREVAKDLYKKYNNLIG